MLLTETLNQWKGLLEREMRGERLNLEPGYAEAYAEWKKTKEEVLPKLSAEERVQLFSDDLADMAQKKMEQLISKKWMGGEQKQTLKSAAQHGDLCLVSMDDGKHFDKALTLEELQKLDPLQLRFLSPTLQSVTNKPEQLKEEQNLLHVSKNLRANHCLVERGYVENHTVHVDVVHQKSDASEVEVDLRSPSTIWNYVFTKKDGSKENVQETQLPEKFGVIAPDISPDLITPLNSIYLMGKKKEANTEQANAAMKAAAASYSTVLAMDQMQAAQFRNKEAQILALSQNGATSPTQNPDLKRAVAQELVFNKVQNLTAAANRFTTNVIESKAAMVAKFAEQQQKMQDQKQRYAQAVQAQAIAQKQMWDKQQEQKKKQKEAFASAQKVRKVAAAVGSAVTGGAIGGFGFVGFWIAHLNAN